MDKINKTKINRINKQQKQFKRNNDNLKMFPTNFSNKTLNDINHNLKIEKIDTDNNKIIVNNINYRKQLIVAKVIISELQDKINEVNDEKKDLENQLNEALNTIKFLHSDYLSLTYKFDKVNENIKMDSNNNEKKFNEVENIINELKAKNTQLNEEILNKQENNKLQEDALNRKIDLLTKKLIKTENELNNYKKRNKDIQIMEKNKDQINTENIMLREDNIKISNKFNDEKKKLYEQIEEHKNNIKKLENENFILSTNLKEKNELLEKERKINTQYNQIDKYFKISNKEKNYNYELVTEKYAFLIKEFDNYKFQALKEKNELIETNNNLNNEKIKLEEEIQKLKDINDKNNLLDNKEEIEILKQEKNYILNLLLKIAPNAKLIEKIIEINKEIIQLEIKKSVIINTNKNDIKLNNIISKIDEQINNFKNHLNSLEDELINIDFGSSRSNIENSMSSSIINI